MDETCFLLLIFFFFPLCFNVFEPLLLRWCMCTLSVALPACVLVFLFML